MSRNCASIVLLVLAPLLVAADAPSGMSPGQWELTRTFGKRTNTVQRCVTAAQLAADPLAVFTPPKGKGPKCITANPVMSGGQLSYSSACTGPMGIKINVQSRGTYTADSFDLNSAMKAMGRDMSIRSTGRRKGAC